MAAAGADEAVVEVEIADHHAIRENSEIHARLDSAAHHACRWRRAHLACELHRDTTRATVVAADRAADRIEDDALRRVRDFFRQIFIAKIDRVARQFLGDGAFLRCHDGRAPLESGRRDCIVWGESYVPMRDSRHSRDGGNALTPGTPEAFSVFLEAEMAKWGEAVRVSGAQVNWR